LGEFDFFDCIQGTTRTYADFADESIFEKKEEEELEDCKITLIITKKAYWHWYLLFYLFTCQG